METYRPTLVAVTLAAVPRPLARVPVAPGAAGVGPLLDSLVSALDGSGPAIAPVPAVSPSTSNSYAMSVLAAVRADDPSVPLESDDVSVVVATSGSTGEPRGVLLTSAQLTAFTAAANGRQAPPLWIVALPVTSIGGLNVLVRALATGNDPVVMPSIGGAEPFTPTGFHQAVTVARGQVSDVRVALVPAQIARLLSAEVGIEALRACTSILVGGAAMRPSLRAMAADLGVMVTTTYGSTETSGGCVFDGMPLPGVVVEALGGTVGPTVLSISSPSVAAGYRCDPESTRERFDGSTFITSDIGTVSADGRVSVVGRADDIVMINGVNVSPGAVERVLSDLPDVVNAASVSVASPGGEAQIWAFVEIRDSAPNVEERGSAAVVERLGKPARPHRIVCVPRLPHLPNGKVDRRQLQAWARDEEGR